MEAPILSPGSIGSKPSWDNGSHGTIAGSCHLQMVLMALLMVLRVSGHCDVFCPGEEHKQHSSTNPRGQLELQAGYIVPGPMKQQCGQK